MATSKTKTTAKSKKPTAKSKTSSTTKRSTRPVTEEKFQPGLMTFAVSAASVSILLLVGVITAL